MAFRFFGEVERLYVRNTGCIIRLENVTPSDAELPQFGYFLLRREHDNYDSLYSLALLAATGRHRLQIRANEDAVSTETAIVNYLVLDW